jgi:transketolase
MRRSFADELHRQMKINDKIFLLVGDLGYKVFDEHFKDFPERSINCGAAEQAMMDIACGLAQDGKIPFVYSITTFLIFRPFETLRTYIDHENLPVKLVGSGRNDDYKHDGASHDATDVGLYLKLLSNIIQYWPKEPEQVSDMVKDMIENDKPSFISLRR